ncbi:4-oxalocrotonate tautomerase [Streptomyces sp. LBUM 1478]|uniref:tautomerase family protein n=1 Tax=Streptomyces scabiei TaxID=1930 RepID=UPI000765C21F|nr:MULTISPECIES: tautomerase family protein [Streptomyces]MBP5910473.1 4-oxalocrotonate tautomerase [Streptomyces sp. LBUM 1478]MBP5933610.1 4-oxalocrotonate tautomerase [Streptomyces sp. LBUM 1479]MBP5873751.1 4-oxalocrotonate tautomerase [Streptomyces sp. LBUM 1477]MBP5881463.1 4-oxalocrotonate tautomerase [Streptomyces sp. LBUM 1487]MBP5895666.1 4-oxalocrotonate tautomerase [Streptomyces sp. LBUM 1481]
MPMIRLTAPAGSLTEKGRASVQRELAAALLRWERAPDLPFFRAQAWSYLIELPEEAQTTAEDDEPRFLVEVTVPQGALDDERRAGLVAEATTTVLDAAGLSQDHAMRVWVLVNDQPEGTWGAGGNVIRFADLVALAREQRAGA